MTAMIGNERVKEFTRHLESIRVPVPDRDVLDLLADEFAEHGAMVVQIDDLEIERDQAREKLYDWQVETFEQATDLHELAGRLLDELAEVAAYDPDEEHEPEMVAAQFEEIQGRISSLRYALLDRLDDMAVEPVEFR